jgi:hypothetical protein
MDGRCVNVNIPDIEKQKDSLPQDVCDANERCAPCFSPLDGKEIGACRSVSCDSPKQPTVTFPGCCVDHNVARGKCVPQASVPADRRDKLDNDSCSQGNLCAPNESLDPTFKPIACVANTFLVGNYTGVCVSDCVKLGFFESLGTDTGSCTSGFFCAPCESFGQPTGAPGCPGTL